MIQLNEPYQEGNKLMEFVELIDGYRKPPHPNQAKGGLNREITDFPFLSRL